MTDYRTRMYETYARSRVRPLAPETLDGLKPRAPYLGRIIREHFPSDPAATILDLGCGHGALLHFLRAAGYTNIRGVDSSLDQVREADRLGIAGVERGDLMETLAAQADGSCGMIVAFDVIEHLTKDEIVGFVDEVRRALRPGGKWLIHTANAESPFGSRSAFGDFTHETFFTRMSIAQLLLSCGFAEVESFEDAPVVHGPVSAIRWVLWKLIRMGLLLYLAAETGRFDGKAVFSQNFLVVARK